ncbi:four-carbon acid sugar kinase family protein [Paraburkholderia edwinii]|uniref:Four-carbon acid sugar kinase family protein n=1 Tax=Paraburkholderia edwinii TaxID=2861782 RepID=A0ABX8UU58_9BURK|nr:four-carbon acid sugar kinase family protein [Paraburkholderia edwinii]QYD72546.1 four-carbon acid sugar kinase family protein [Paraburkholderia edwinii]
MSMLIVADDLSGAADCAIGFANAGRHTVVALGADEAVEAANDAAAGRVAVIALDTDSRRLAPADAASRAAQAWRVLGGTQGVGTSQRRLYKKIDSTLRGNWVAEVAALQPLAGLAIVAPAFPATGRTVREGRVFVRGVPLGETETWQLEHAGKTADLQPMLEEAGLRTALFDVERMRDLPPDLLAQALAEHARAGVHALIVDAQNEADLNLIARATLVLHEAFFWVGSGGLARELAALPELFGNDAPAPVAPLRREGPILTLVGSLSAVSGAQCALLRERTGMAELVVPPAVLRKVESHPESAQWRAAIGAPLAAGRDLLVRIGRDDAFDPSEGTHLSTALAALVEPHVGHLAGLIATGGETARAMLSQAGIGSLELLSEVEPGVAVAQPSDDVRRLTVVTKAGAFGSDHALYGAWLHLRGLQEATRNGSQADSRRAAHASRAPETNSPLN